MSDNQNELAYFNQLFSEEYDRSHQCIGSMAPKLDRETQESIATMVAQVSTRLRVVEEYLVKGQHSSSISRLSSAVFAPLEAKKSISEFYADNLGLLQWNKQGIPYKDVLDAQSISWSLDVSRRQKMTLAIDIEYGGPQLLRRCIIKVDGKTEKLRLKKINGIKRLICHLPESKSVSPTVFELSFPPSLNNKESKLAISDIYCVPRMSVSSFIKKQFV